MVFVQGIKKHLLVLSFLLFRGRVLLQQYED